MSRTESRDIATYIVNQLDAGVDRNELIQKVAAYLLKYRRTNDLYKIMRSVDTQLIARGTHHIVITSAHEVTDDIKNKLAKILNVSNPLFSEVIDSRVIGGVRATCGDLQVDLTVKTRLQNFKTEVMRSM